MGRVELARILSTFKTRYILVAIQRYTENVQILTCINSKYIFKKPKSRNISQYVRHVLVCLFGTRGSTVT